jgi:hypothetical protein
LVRNGPILDAAAAACAGGQNGTSFEADVKSGQTNAQE